MPRVLFAALMGLAILPAGFGATDADSGIRAALNTQVEAWNRGDITAFVSSYAEDCTFVGKTILQGRDHLLARYRKAYPTSDAMGKLTFSNLKVRPLDGKVAVVTGEWHLDRAASGGGPVGGVFSLVWELRSGEWRIVLDHTS